MSTNAKTFYAGVVNDVIERNRQQFINEGVSEDVLEKLRKIWEEKINQKLTPEIESKVGFEYQHQEPNYAAMNRGVQYQNYWNHP